MFRLGMSSNEELYNIFPLAPEAILTSTSSLVAMFVLITRPYTGGQRREVIERAPHMWKLIHLSQHLDQQAYLNLAETYSIIFNTVFCLTLAAYTLIVSCILFQNSSKNPIEKKDLHKHISVAKSQTSILLKTLQGLLKYSWMTQEEFLILQYLEWICCLCSLLHFPAKKGLKLQFFISSIVWNELSGHPAPKVFIILDFDKQQEDVMIPLCLKENWFGLRDVPLSVKFGMSWFVKLHLVNIVIVLSYFFSL